MKNHLLIMFNKIYTSISLPIKCLHLKIYVFVVLLKVTTHFIEHKKKVNFYSDLQKFSFQ